MYQCMCLLTGGKPAVAASRGSDRAQEPVWYVKLGQPSNRVLTVGVAIALLVWGWHMACSLLYPQKLARLQPLPF